MYLVDIQTVHGIDIIRTFGGNPIYMKTIQATTLVMWTLILTTFTSCGVKNAEMLSSIDNKKIITLYKLCGDGESRTMTDHYLFKIKDDRITLTEKRGDRIKNKQSYNTDIGNSLKQFIKESKERTDVTTACQYYVKCGISECAIYPDDDDLIQFEKILMEIDRDNLANK